MSTSPSAKSSGKTPTATRNLRYERLPFPLGPCWSAAARARDTNEAYRALENVLRFWCAVVWADVLDLPWDEAAARALAGGDGHDGLERMSMGDRVSLLRTLVQVHGKAPGEGPPRVLPPLADWWEEANHELAEALRERNKAAHGMAFREDGFDAAMDRLYRVLKLTKWLGEVQLVVVQTGTRKNRTSQGVVQRLAGLVPFDDPKHRFDATWRADLTDGAVYVVSGDGARWAACPFLALEGRSLSLLDAIGRKGELYFGDPMAAPGTSRPEGRGIPGGDGDLRWHAFLAERESLAPELRFTEDKPHELLKLPPGAGKALEPGQRLGDDHRLVKLLGEGGMATVWEAEDVHTKARVALKVPRPEMADTEFEARFRREIELLKKLHAEGVRRVLGPVRRLRIDFDDEPLTILEMPLLKETLADRLKSLQAKKQLPAPEDVAKWLEQTLESLVDLHSRGVIHRDIKPSNLLLDANDDVVLGDFGIARDEGADAKLTKTMSNLGSLHYMAPELNRSAKNVSDKSDVFSLAVSMHELARGKAVEQPGRGVSGLLGVLLVQMGKGEPDERPSAADVLQRIVASRDTDPPGIEPRPVRIEPGEFWLGASERREGYTPTIDEELPQHRVRITRPFEMWNVPVTQGQYEALMGANPSICKGRADRPVEEVSWYDAVRYCNALSAKYGLEPAYEVVDTEDADRPLVTWKGLANGGWRLPTEAEWEYACRAGTAGPRYGETIEVAWYDENSNGRTHAVGLKKPNAWGLHDTLGNVWEWCWDWHADYWDPTEALDPDGTVVWNEAGEASLNLGRHKGRTLRALAAELPEYLRFIVEDEELFSQALCESAAAALDGVYRSRVATNDDPVGPTSGTARVNRGGCWFTRQWCSRASCRGHDSPSYRDCNLGFRPVRTLPK